LGHSAALLAASLLAGCGILPATGMVQKETPKNTESSAASAAIQTNSQSEAPPTSNLEKPAKPPAPRTLCQALHAYLRSVCSPKPPGEDAKHTPESGDADENKGQPAQGESEDQGKLGRKSPSSARQQGTKDQQQGEGETKEEPEKKENGKNEKDVKEK